MHFIGISHITLTLYAYNEVSLLLNVCMQLGLWFGRKQKKSIKRRLWKSTICTNNNNNNNNSKWSWLTIKLKLSIFGEGAIKVPSIRRSLTSQPVCTFYIDPSLFLFFVDSIINTQLKDQPCVRAMCRKFWPDSVAVDVI